ncbi:hypothetical protein BT96DRAFT_486629 [Gymnopus androsaceus JB14]|uniref:STE3-domain-containing protein n=1 Tax=Gymnopus androsaceus JB14 TaxID=1447944 RepID=A0A6A4I0K4_9AGAR|nr:hypothetical protein BT96DRAFT_486629 [Gymnopus androsaceus JB14]
MRSSVIAFCSLQLVGACFFLLLILTAALSKRVKRFPTWYSFCFSWIISCMSYSLILVMNAYAGAGGFKHSDSDLGSGSRRWQAERVCLTQAALIYASPALTGFTSLAMCLHVFLYIRAALKGRPEDVKTITTTLLVAIPYIIWTVMFVVLFQLGQAMPHAVQLGRAKYYCHLELPEPVTVCSAIAVIAAVGVAVVEGWMVFEVHKHRSSLERTTHPMAFIIRVLVFGLVDLFALIVGILFLLPITRGLGVEFLLSLIPLLGILIFGSQKDMLQVWMFWNKSTSELDTSSPNSNPTNTDNPDNFTLRQPSSPSQRSRWRSSSQSYLASPSSQFSPSSPKHLSQTSDLRPLSGSVYQYRMEDAMDGSQPVELYSALDKSKSSIDTMDSPQSPVNQENRPLEFEQRPIASAKPWIYRSV